MAKYLNVCGNYRVIVTDGGTITLDTGAVGNVIVTGNLTVQGTTTTIDTAVMVIEDRIITLNRNGFSGGEITDIGGQQRAGIEIDRGGNNTYWLFDENINTEADGPGAWVGLDGSNNIIGIRTTSIDTAGTDLYLISQGTGVVTVQGTNNYQEQILEYTGAPGSRVVNFAANPIVKEPDALLNAKAMEDYIDGFFVGRFQTRIESGTITPSFVAVHDAEDFAVSESQIEFTLDSTPVAFFYNNRTELQHIRITDTKIETTSSNNDLILSAPGAGSVKIDDTLLLTPVPHSDDDGTSGGAFPNQGFDADINNPDAPTEGVKVYAKSEGPAGTSIYFVNSNTTQDELVSKKKSILFSMIF